MHDSGGTDLLHQPKQVGPVRQVELVEFGARIHGSAVAFAEVIEDNNIVAKVQELLDANAADVAGSACDKNFHGAQPSQSNSGRQACDVNSPGQPNGTYGLDHPIGNQPR